MSRTVPIRVIDGALGRLDPALRVVSAQRARKLRRRGEAVKFISYSSSGRSLYAWPAAALRCPWAIVAVLPDRRAVARILRMRRLIDRAYAAAVGAIMPIAAAFDRGARLAGVVLPPQSTLAQSEEGTHAVHASVNYGRAAS